MSGKFYSINWDEYELENVARNVIKAVSVQCITFNHDITFFND